MNENQSHGELFVFTPLYFQHSQTVRTSRYDCLLQKLKTLNLCLITQQLFRGMCTKIAYKY